MNFRTALAIAGAALAGPALAQPSTGWTVVAKITAGKCRDGSKANAIEIGPMLRLILVDRDGREYAAVDVALGADGTGRAEFKDAEGHPTMIEVAAGRGKRQLHTRQLDGDCAWTWK